MFESLTKQIKEESEFCKIKSGKYGEVFTPFNLIKEMTSHIPEDYFSDPSKTFFDPAAGKGNFPIVLIMKLFIGLSKVIPDKEERLKHIVEKQIYMAEIQKESAEFIHNIFQFDRGFRVNLYYGDTLKMPEDFFDLSWEERKIKYPENTF